MKKNILLVGLDYDFVKNITYELANKFDMFFLDVQDLIEYRIIDKKNMQTLCGIEYYQREERGIIKEITQYENTLTNIPYSLILNDEYYKLLKNHKIIFINLKKEFLEKLNLLKNEANNLIIELLTYEELLQLVIKKSNTIVEIDSLDISECVNKIEKLNII